MTEVAFTSAALRQFPTAVKLYDQALDILPNELYLMASKASIYQAEGNLQEAAKLLVQVNAQTNSDMAVRVKFAQLRLERHRSVTIRFIQARHDGLNFSSPMDQGIKPNGAAWSNGEPGDPR